MLEYERLIGGIEERIRLMTRGKLYRRMRQGAFPTRNLSSENHERGFSADREPPLRQAYIKEHFLPDFGGRDERPTVGHHARTRSALAERYNSPCKDSFTGHAAMNYQVPQSNTPLTHSRLSMGKSPTAATPLADGERLADMVGMVVPSVISYVKHYLRENSLEQEQQRVQDRIKMRRNQELVKSFEGSPEQQSRIEREHRRSGSFGTRNEARTPCSACSGVKERLSALEQALHLNNVRTENLYQDNLGVQNQLVTTTPKGFSSRLKKTPTGHSTKRTTGDRVSTEKKSLAHSVSSRSQSRKSLLQHDRDFHNPPALKSSIISPIGATPIGVRTKKKKVSLKLPSAAKFSRDESRKSSRTAKSQKSKSSKSADSRSVSKPNKPKRLKTKATRISESSLGRKSEVSNGSKSRCKKKVSKPAISLDRSDVRSLKKKKSLKGNPSERSGSAIASSLRLGSKPDKPCKQSAIGRKPSVVANKRPILAHSLVLDSKPTTCKPNKFPASVKSAMTPKGLLRSKAPQLTHSTSIKNNNTSIVSQTKPRGKSKQQQQEEDGRSQLQRVVMELPPVRCAYGQQTPSGAVVGGLSRASRLPASKSNKDHSQVLDSHYSAVDGVVQRLHTVSSRFASAATTPLSRCDK